MSNTATGVFVCSICSYQRTTAKQGVTFVIDATLEVTRALSQPIVAVTVGSVSGQSIFANDSLTDGVELSLPLGTNAVRVRYEAVPLVRGTYCISIVVAEGSMNNQALAVLNAGRLEVTAKADDLA